MLKSTIKNFDDYAQPIKPLLLGSTNFNDIIKKDLLYIDKSLLIKEMLERKAEEVTLITRPRRWGKTLNMSMLQHFFADEVNGQKTAGLFNNLAINQVKTATGESYVEQYQGKYPVIFVSFKDVKAEDVEQAKEKIYQNIVDVCQEHAYLLKSDKLDVFDQEKLAYFIGFLPTTPRNAATQSIFESALKNLSKLLAKHYDKKCYILIDEYDTPLQAAYDQGYFDQLANFMRNIFSNTLKGNDYLEKGLLTGILDLSKNSVYSGLNNLNIYTVLNGEYSQYFGFTETEVQSILHNQRITDIDMQDIKDWYNGYHIGDDDDYTMVYNPWSIMKCLNTTKKGVNRFEPYWINTGDLSFIKQILLSNENIVEGFEQLTIEEDVTVIKKINKNITYQDITSSSENIWSFLLHTGYLTTAGVQPNGDYVLTIPNQEVKATYRDIFIHWLQQAFKPAYQAILTSLTQGQVEQFRNLLADHLLDNTSPLSYASESNYQCVMNTLFTLLKNNDKYRINNGNLGAGLGIPDCIITPINKNQSLGLILEYKVHHLKDEKIKGNMTKINATLKTLAKETALKQIEHRAYEKAFTQESHIKEVLCIGLAFYDRCVGVAYQTVNLIKNS